jgi:hypothetical protein
MERIAEVLNVNTGQISVPTYLKELASCAEN